MRNLLIAAILTTFSLAALADCTEAYQKASKRRNQRNLIVVGVVAGTAGAAAIGGGAIIVPTFFFVGSVSALGVASGFEPGGMFSNNNFNKILTDFKTLQEGADQKHLSKIIADGLDEAGLDASNEEKISHARRILLDGFNSSTFCPVVKIKKNGDEKRAVFNRRALVKYLAENL